MLGWRAVSGEWRAVKIDIYNPDNYVEAVPHEQFQWLRDNAPVYWHPYPQQPEDGFWVVSRHEDVMQVSRDHKTFSSERGFVMVDDLPPDILKQAQGQLLGMDPPRHSPLRRAVITRFTTRMLDELEPKVRAIVAGVVDDALQLDECDFVFDIAGKLPTAVIGTMLGVPPDMWQQLREWSDLQTSAQDPDIGGSDQSVQQASLDMGMYGYQLACERRDGDGEDLISLLINFEVDGHRVTAEEFASLFVQITVAGNETTRGLIAGGMYELLQRPELYRELAANPALLPGAVEEMLRWTCPLHYFRRTATADTELAGQKIRRNDRVVMSYTSANFDEAVFADPFRFDIRRDPNPHMAFGHGIHLCLGANLARLEARAFFEEWFRRGAGLALAGEPRRIRSNLVNGFKHMPVRIRP